MALARVLVLGAAGYIGSRLVGVLLEKGHTVRAAGKSRVKLEKCAWSRHQNVELIETDVLSKPDIETVCRDCGVVYYLVHSMNLSNHDFVRADRQAAQNMVEAAFQAGVQRIIYLGGLGEDEKTLSKHLRSRMEVLHILHAGPVPVTSLRAAMIIGRGSISYEMLHYLVDRLPVIAAPAWISTESQPIAVSNVIRYLTGCLETEATKNEVFDIGGPDILSYRQLMDIYAEEAGLRKRLVISVPRPLVPVLSFLWTGFISQPSYIARPLLEGLRNRVVCQDNRIRGIIPQELLDCHQAIRAALGE